MPGLTVEPAMHRANSAIAAGVMLAESDNLVRPLPGLLDGLNRADCNRLRAIGREKALEAGQLVWSQGDTQAGICLLYTSDAADE